MTDATLTAGQGLLVQESVFAPSVASPGMGGDDTLTPIDLYLRSQQELTAVDRFSRLHDDDASSHLQPAQARYYQDLIPLGPPGEGQQYAFSVDLDSCTGCKSCVTACHSLNGLDEGESFRSAGLLIGARDRSDGVGDGLEPWQQTVTTACHHCIDPACLKGCPVDAYEKDPVTGIVRHLDDQCIGCSYCTLTCPYEVPRYNARLGIVRKCDMCSDRLAVGEAPACVQGCPTHAISVEVIDRSTALAALVDQPGVALVPNAPPSSLTLPTTSYRSLRPMPAQAVAGDHHSLRPSHSHLPLAVMLVLTQVSVGAFVADLMLRAVASDVFAATIRPYAAAGALIVAVLALGASTFHLGRPLHAWRAVLGLGHSWLSREIVTFSVFAAAAAAYAGAVWRSLSPALVTILGSFVVISGVAGVLCSAMIYAVTGRRWWRLAVTAPKFVLTAAATGPALALTLGGFALAVSPTGAGAVEGGALRSAVPLLGVIVLATVAKLALEGVVLLHLRDATFTDERRTAILLTDDLRTLSVRRVTAALIGGVVLPLVLVGLWSEPVTSTTTLPWSLVLLSITLGLLVAGELAERRCFFSAVSAPRMPGALS